jgi:hypothetical protein
VIDKFTNLNFVGDKKIEDQLNTLRAKLQTVDPKDLKEKEEIRKELGVMAAQIAKEAADISDVSEITGQYKRRIDTD